MIESRAATSPKFRGGKVTFGNDYDVSNVQSTMMPLFCYDQLNNIGGGTFFIVGGPWSSAGGQNGHFLSLLFGMRTKYARKPEVNSLIRILIELILAMTVCFPV